MKKITLLLFFLFFSIFSYSQIEGFENTTGPDLPNPETPSDWTLGTGTWAVFDSGNGIGTTRRWGISNAAANVYGGTNSAYMDREFIGQGNTCEDYLSTPLITIPANGQLRFYTRSTLGGDTGTIYQIKVAPATATQINPTAYTTIQQWTETTLTANFNTYEQKVVDLSAYAGTQIYISFVMRFTQTGPGLSGDRWLVDDVQVVQQCFNPTALTVNPITFNGGSLSWTSPGVTSWEIEILPATGTPTGVGTIYSGALPYVVTNLLPNTNYQYFVKALCSPGVTSQWAGPFNFTTTTAPPICGGNYVDTGGVGGNYSNNEDSTVTICPTNPGDVVTVTFTSFNTEATYDGLYVFDGNGITSPQLSSTNGAGNVTGGLPGSYWGTTIPGPFTATSANGCLTFRFRSEGFGTASGWVANVTCGLPPTCPRPNNVTSSAVTSTSATIAWANPNTATSWHILALPCGSPIPTASSTGFVVANSNPFTLTGLNADTCYDVYVRAVCSASDLSDWSGATTFTTQITPPVCGGTYSDPGGSSADYQSNSDSTVTICPINPGDVVTVTFTTFETEANWDGLYVFNGNSTASTQISSGNPGGNVPGGLPGSFWGDTIPEPFTSTSPDGCLTFRFRSDGSVNFAGWTANVACGLPPTCPRPNTLTTSTVTSTNVTLGWTNPNSATAWHVLAVPCGSPPPTAATTGFILANSNPFTFTTLTPDTCYDFYVRAICSPTDLSDWSGVTSATTQILPPVCGATFTDPAGANAPYASNTDYTISICPTIPGEQVTVTFLTFETEQNWDGLYVYNGNSIASPQISSTNPGANVPGGLPGSFWGNAIPGPFTGDSPTGCLTFRFRSDGSVNFDGWTANVTCAPPPTCPRPTLVTVLGTTQTSVTVGWTEVGPATTWEVLVLPIGSPIPTASTTGWISTTSNPYTYSGLPSGTQFVVYVRSHCSDSDISFWSTPGQIFATLITNDECANAIVAPVNPDTSCALTVGGTLIGATQSPQPTNCFGSTDDDVWFQFTAVTTTHYIAINNIVGNGFDLGHAVYSGSCGTLTELLCSNGNQSTATGLIPGQVYFVRIYSFTATPNQNTTFNLCIGTIPPPITTNTTQFTNVQIIENVLLNTTCASVTNITSSTGTNFGSTNGIGYFNRNGSTFPFEEGVVLTTGNANNAPGPNNSILGDGSFDWTGDADLEAIILAATGLPMNSRNATKLEFDFVPLTNTISFNFIFASEEYGTFQCSFSDAFAFLLTDISTGITTNLAVLPNTTIPVSVVTIRDQAYNNGCASANEQFFDQYYQLPEGASPLGAPINFNGVTVPLTATANVVLGNQYHIKMVIADRQDTAFDSAVFLEGGSLDIGSIELGGDFLQSDGTALCANSSYTITSDLDPTLYSFAWTVGGTVIPNATGPNLTINSPGVYELTASYVNTTCSSSDSVTIEYYDVITPGTPNNLVVCNNLGFAQFDLSSNNASSLGSLSPAAFNVTYYLTNADAVAELNPLPSLYTNTVQFLQTIYVRVENTLAGCFGITQFNLIVQDLTPQFTITPNFSICANTTGTISVTPTNYNPNDVTYSWTLNGNPYPATTSTITVTQAGSYVVTVNNTGCTATGTTTVTVTPIATPDDPADVISCGNYTLPSLTNGNYFTGSNGSGTAYVAGDVISQSGTLYVYSQSGTTPNCTAENSFSITINQPVVPTFTAVGPLCQNATAPILPTLSNNNITGTWNAPITTTVVGTTQYVFTPAAGECASPINISVTIVSPTTATFTQIQPICQGSTAPSLPTTSTNLVVGVWTPSTINTATAGTTLYTFVPNSGQCAVGTTMNITINTTPVVNAIADVIRCTNYTLPTIAGGNYYTAANGQGTQIAAGTVISTSQTIYFFAQSGTVPNCTDEESFDVTINKLPDFAIDGGCQGSSYILTATPLNSSFNENAVNYSWTNATGATVGTTQSITVGTAGTYTCTITINATGCSSAKVFTANDITCTIQKGISPNNDGLNDSFDLSTLDVKMLNIFNRYGSKVYSKTNYSNEWFGQADNGNELPDGTYYYVIEFNGADTKSGWIYINREIK